MATRKEIVLNAARFLMKRSELLGGNRFPKCWVLSNGDIVLTKAAAQRGARALDYLYPEEEYHGYNEVGIRDAYWEVFGKNMTREFSKTVCWDLNLDGDKFDDGNLFNGFERKRL